jgi:hypothetical protein
MVVLNIQSRGLAKSSAEIVVHRTNRTTMMMTSRRPTEPPPIQMALAITGENKSDIIILSFCDGISVAVGFWSYIR